jgi:hypothetical protein
MARRSQRAIVAFYLGNALVTTALLSWSDLECGST